MQDTKRSSGKAPAESSAGDETQTGTKLSRRSFLEKGAVGLSIGAIPGGALVGDAFAHNSKNSKKTDDRDHDKGHKNDHNKRKKPKPFLIEEQGSFMAGGTEISNPGTFDPTAPSAAGNTLKGDHLYAFYQIPPDARELPMVMWHGGLQSGKGWESNPDGDEGYATRFVRRGFAVYVIDQPRTGKASRTTVGGTVINATPDEKGTFTSSRLGIWPDFFPGVQFPRDPESLNQFFRQRVVNTGPGGTAVSVSAVVALFERIGPGILITHSAASTAGWLTAIQSRKVKSVIAYEPTSVVFPEGAVPPAGGTAVPAADFLKLTKIPIQIIFGDNIPTTPSPYPGLDMWRVSFERAEAFVQAVNAAGGDAQLLHLPKIGVRGNTHYPFANLNAEKIADLLSDYLKRKRLDRR